MVQQNDMTQLLSRGKYLEPTNDSLTDWKPAQLYLAVWADLYGSSRLQEPSAMIWTGNLIQNQNTQLFFILSQTNNK